MWCDYGEVKKKLHPGVESAESIKDVLELTAGLGDRTYLVDAVTHEEFSYEASDLRVNRVARVLLRMGLSKGDRVGFLMGNSPRCIFTLLGIFKAGMTAVPINYNFREKEIDHLVKTAGISTIVVDPRREYLRLLLNVSAQNETLNTILIYGPGDVTAEAGATIFQMEDLLAEAKQTPLTFPFAAMTPASSSLLREPRACPKVRPLPIASFFWPHRAPWPSPGPALPPGTTRHCPFFTPMPSCIP
jgi:acyl-CoA synthetase (AMP-forming)/AMP-acid ligase II